jgi:hypothetical protein
MAQPLLLEHLPTEILAAIFSSIHDPQSLLNICLQSSFFRQVAEPVLYSNFSGPDGNEFGKTKRTRDFHVAILRRPELAQHVRSMTIQAHWTQIGSCPPEELERFKSKEVAMLFPAAQSRVTSSTYRNWLHQVHEGPEEVLLLAAVRKLESLHLSMGWYPVRYFEEIFSLACLENVDILKRLRVLKISYRAYGRGLNLSSFLPLLLLPQLKTFEACYVSIDLDDERLRDSIYFEGMRRPRQYDYVPDSLSFSKLKLYESAICGPAITKMLIACKALSVFHYSNGSPGRGYEQFSPLQLFLGLRKHSESLEVLRLVDLSTTLLGTEKDHILGSLADFTRLRSVGAEQTVLVGLPAPSRNCTSCVLWECNLERPTCKCLRIHSLQS